MLAASVKTFKFDAFKNCVEKTLKELPVPYYLTNGHFLALKMLNFDHCCTFFLKQKKACSFIYTVVVVFINTMKTTFDFLFLTSFQIALIYNMETERSCQLTVSLCMLVNLNLNLKKEKSL